MSKKPAFRASKKPVSKSGKTAMANKGQMAKKGGKPNKSGMMPPNMKY